MPELLEADAPAQVACVNGVALHAPNEVVSQETLRQRACTELLRQEAARLDIAGSTTSQAIDALLDQAIDVPEPSAQACRRVFDANPARYALGERLRLRHVLFAVTAGVDVNALRQRAEALLLELRCADPESDAFGTAATRWSNCPTGADGGDIGWVTRDDCAAEFAREVFAQQTVGILPRLVHSRFGFHVVEVCSRDAGVQPTFEAVQCAIAATLRQQTWANALRQYLQVLAGRARLAGVDLQAADSPLVQ
jgi:peptidyl-prolyl cis-trans isomerase C